MLDVMKIALRVKNKHPLDDTKHVTAATHFVKHFRPELVAFQGDVFAYTGTHYVAHELLDAEVQAAYHGFPIGRGEQRKRWSLNSSDTKGIIEALKTMVKTTHKDAPFWRKPRPEAAEDCVSFTNGILHVPTRRLLPHTPDFFTTYSLPHPYDPDAGEPVEWLAFLEPILAPNSIAVLQEWIGYLISGETRAHKFLWMMGPTRCGKGTILRVTTTLIGQSNVAAPKLRDLAEPFGVMQLLNKTAALVGDARMKLMDKARREQAIENLLSITGGDLVSVNRKNAGYWQGYLRARFMVASNNPPEVDNSSALMTRTLLIRMTKSFAGCEDMELDARLMEEAPQIVNWALDGLDRLRANGWRFTSNAADIEDVVEELGLDQSPVAQWFRESYVFTGNPQDQINRSILRVNFNAWARNRKLDPIDEPQWFTKHLRKALPGVVADRKKDSYRGVKRRSVPNVADSVPNVADSVPGTLDIPF